MAGAGVADVCDVMEQVSVAAVVAADAARGASDAPPGPVVHLLAAGDPDPYLGYVRCRAFRPGSDATTAIGLLGWLPAALGASHVVFVWEVASVRAALEPSTQTAVPGGLAVVEASLTDHVARWLPFGASAGEWGPARVYPGALLPVPFEYALRSWRTRVVDDGQAVVDMLERAAYRVRLTARS